MKNEAWKSQPVRHFWAVWGGLFGGCSDLALKVLLEKLNRNSKTVVVADGSGNLDNEAIVNETWGVGYVQFSKTGHGEKVKPVKPVRDSGWMRVWPPQSPHPPQARLQPMFISRSGCAKLISTQ
jgi:hypothetical protein